MGSGIDKVAVVARAMREVCDIVMADASCEEDKHNYEVLMVRLRDLIRIEKRMKWENGESDDWVSDS